MDALAVSFGIRHKHARVLTPSMFIAHEPQIPSRHDLRNVNVGSISFLILICSQRAVDANFAIRDRPAQLTKASSIIGPHCDRSTSYVCSFGFSVGVSGFCRVELGQMRQSRWSDSDQSSKRDMYSGEGERAIVVSNVLYSCSVAAHPSVDLELLHLRRLAGSWCLCIGRLGEEGGGSGRKRSEGLSRGAGDGSEGCWA